MKVILWGKILKGYTKIHTVSKSYLELDTVAKARMAAVGVVGSRVTSMHSSFSPLLGSAHHFGHAVI